MKRHRTSSAAHSTGGAAGAATSTTVPAPALVLPWLPGSRLAWPRPWVVAALSAAGALTVVGWEMHTSTLQSRWFSRYAGKLTWSVREGGCEAPMPAPSGPYDRRLGYSQLAALRTTLTARDFTVARQACPSPDLRKLAARGIAPPYDEKHTGTLVILNRTGGDLYRAPIDRFQYTTYGELPLLLVESLLFIENRQLLDQERRHLNPAVEWDRLFLASANFALDKVHDQGRVMGGSTLATQMEKFRHSPAGRTAGGGDKVRQIVSASLRAYRKGPDTRDVRKEIILDYINSMPLGAASGEGEIVGLGHGMWSWFEKSPADLVRDLTLNEDDGNLRRKAETYKQALALVMATRRPTLYLQHDRTELEARIRSFLPLLVEHGTVSPQLAAAVREAPLRFRTAVPKRERVAFTDRKATNAVRAELLELLDARNLYELDRFDLRVETSIDASVQERVTALLRRFRDPDFVARKGFYGDHLLESGTGQDPGKILWSFSLYESTPAGNRMRVNADNLEEPLDINRNVKLELGSTAKLRTMANYLMVVADLHARFRAAPEDSLWRAERLALDPITRWAARWVLQHPEARLATMLDASLDRSFSADPNEQFFTGRGLHTFGNFDDELTGPVPLRHAFQQSINLCYIRLMRELVQYYTAQLGFDQRAILADANNPQRADLLDAAMIQEGRETLRRFFNRYDGMAFDAALRQMCGKAPNGLKRLAIFHLAEFPDATLPELRAEAHRVFPDLSAAQDSLLRSYHRMFAGRRPADEPSLLGRHALEVWLVHDRRDHPRPAWGEVVERSADARRAAMAWIQPARFKDAQNLRLRIELERRAFREIHAAWAKLGYPFGSLVPSLATAIGSSADRPSALAELVGIIQNGGRRAPFLRVDALHFAEGTPYETHFEPKNRAGEPQNDQVMAPEVAAALRDLMISVVEGGTGRRAQGALRGADGKPLAIGGKTGSGDNRNEKVAADGSVLSSRAINRTASFVFVIGTRYFGMITAYVPGEEAGKYRFTSSLALQAFRTLAPAIETLVAGAEPGPMAAATEPPSPLATRRDPGTPATPRPAIEAIPVAAHP